MGLYLLTSSWILGRGILELWGDLSLYSLFAFLLKLNMAGIYLSNCVFVASLLFPTSSWCGALMFVDCRFAPVMCRACPCCVLWDDLSLSSHGALLSLHPPSSTYPELRRSTQGNQKPSQLFLFLTCQPSLSLLRFARLKWTHLRFWQADGRVGRGLLCADCCFSWRQQSGPEHSSVRED